MLEDIIATERVDVQLYSVLAKRTVVLCQETLDYFASTRTTDANGTPVPADSIRIAQTTRYMIKTFGPALRTILKETVNLDIYEFHFIEAVYTPLDAFMYPVFTKLKDREHIEVSDIEDMFSGTQAAVNAKVTKLDIFSAAASRIDLTTSKLGDVDYAIGFGITTTAFIVPECFNNAEVFTAEELAAVILHEVGHGLTILEHAADIYYRADAIYDSVNLKELATAQGRQKAAATLTTAVSDAATMEKLPAPAKVLVSKAATAASDTNIPTNPYLIGLMAVAIFVLTLWIVWIKVLDILLSMAISGAVSGLPGMANRGPKTSDTVVTRSNYAYVEKIADEFVARHGLGGALITGLEKLYTGQALHRGLLIDAMYQNALGRVFLLGCSTFRTFFGYAWSAINYTYDPDILRLENALKNHLVLFKNPNLPTDLRNRLISDTQASLSAIAKYKAMPGVKLREAFWGTILRLTTRGSIVDGIAAANLSVDYDQLQQMTNGLLKNPFYYAAARVQKQMDVK